MVPRIGKLVWKELTTYSRTKLVPGEYNPVTGNLQVESLLGTFNIRTTRLFAGTPHEMTTCEVTQTLQHERFWVRFLRNLKKEWSKNG